MFWKLTFLSAHFTTSSFNAWRFLADFSVNWEWRHVVLELPASVVGRSSLCPNLVGYFMLRFTCDLIHEMTTDSVTLPLQMFGHFVIQQNMILSNINFISVSVEKYLYNLKNIMKKIHTALIFTVLITISGQKLNSTKIISQKADANYNLFETSL